MAIYNIPGPEPASKVLSNGDHLYIYDSGSISGYSILSGGNLYVSRGGLAQDIILSNGGNAVVNSSGVASNVVINYGGVITVSSGGSADIVFNPWSGTVNVAEGAIVTYQDAAGVYYGATDVGLVSKAVGGNVMTNLEVANGRSAFVINGGILQGAYTTSHGTILVAQGGYASATVIYNKGSMEVSSGGSALDVDVKKGGALTISQAGSAGEITISSGGALYVQNNGHLTGSADIRYGGYFNGFTFAGNVNIYNGADAIVLQKAANAVVMNTVADLWNNQTAIGAKISRGANLQIHSGGLASSAHVQELGTINVYAGGVASGTLMTGSRHATVERNNSSWKYCNFADYFTGVTTTVATGTHEFLYNTNHYIFSSGSLEDSPYAEFPGQITRTHLDANEMVVHNGGSALDTAVSSGGVLTVDGGYASKTFLEGTKWDVWNYYYTVTKKEEQGRTTYESKLASSARFSEGTDSSYAHVMNGGVVVATELGSYGGLYISKAGTADYTFINDSGSAHVLEGGLASHTNIYSRGNLYVSQGGTADRTYVNSGGSMNVLVGGVASNTFVNSMGYAYIFEGGVSDENLIMLAGSMFVNNGGIVSNTFVNSGGKLYVSAGGSAHIAYMPSGWMGTIEAAAGATVTYADKPAAGVYYGGDAYGLLYKNDTVDGSKLVTDPTSEENKQIRFDFTSGQSALVFEGGVFSNGKIDNTGALYVYNGGIVTNTTAKKGASINGFILREDNGKYDSGFAVSNAIVFSGASASLFGNTQTAEKVWINAGGSVFVGSGATLGNMNLASGGSITVAKGGILKGAFQIDHGAELDIQEDTEYQYIFAIEGREAADGVLINDLALLKGLPTFSISADYQQVSGEYELARNASFENGEELAFTITGGEEEYVASLTVNGTGEAQALYYNGIFYKLTQTSNGTLTLAVTDAALMPLYIDVIADETEFTSDGVTLSVKFAEFATVRKYSKDNGGSWTDVDGFTTSIRVTENATYTFFAEDTNGNLLEKTFVVDNIDRDAPVINTYVDNTDPSRIIVTAWADDGMGSGVESLKYRINGGAWVEYNESITITENCKLEFLAKDKLGNEDTLPINFVTIEDKTPPEITTSVDNTALTNENVTITATATDGSGISLFQYQIYDGEKWSEWTTCTGKVVMEKNGIVKFKAVDINGNSTERTEEITNIDKTPPAAPKIFVDTEDVDRKQALLTAVFPEDSVENMYSTDGGETWTAYPVKGVVIKENSTVYFRAKDEAGNFSTSSKSLLFLGEANIFDGSELVAAAESFSNMSIGEGNVGELMQVSAGGAANNTTVGKGGLLQAFAGGVIKDTLVQDHGEVSVEKDAVANKTRLQDFGALLLSSGGLARETLIDAKGALHVYSGGVASETQIQDKGFLGVGADAKVYDTEINAGGTVKVWGGGIAYMNTINKYGSLILSNGAVARSTHIHSGGGLHIYSGGYASHTQVDQGGFLGIGSGGYAVSTTINEKGSLKVWAGGTGDVTLVKNGGSLILLEGAIANSTTIQENGGLHIYSGATAYTTFVTSGAFLGVGGGGTLYNSYVDYNNSVVFYDDSCLRGWNEFAGSIFVRGTLHGEGAKIAFMVSERSTADDVIIDNIAGIEGASYFVTVDSDMAAGKYLLAGNAGDFNGFVTITGTAEKIHCGKRAITVDGFAYSLRVDRNDDLYLEVVKSSRAADTGEDALSAASQDVASCAWENETSSAVSALDGEDLLSGGIWEEAIACGTSMEIGVKAEERDPLLAIA